MAGRRTVGGECERLRGRQDPAAHDIVFPEHDFRMRWNLAEDGGLWRTSSSATDERAIVLNTYRTLMTRGMKGCGVYCVDEETGESFRGVLEG
jgi:hypothetical protein